MKPEFKQQKNLAIKAVKQAGKLIMRYYQQADLKMKHKSRHEIVTPADTGAEKIILGMIKKQYPQHQILSEESGLNKKTSDYLWIVDPLDGTTNFYYKNPLFATSMALVYQGEIQFSVIWAPTIKELYLAEKGRGARLNGRSIQVSRQANPRNSLFTFCFGYRRPGIKRAFRIHEHYAINGLSIRQIGCASLEFAFVACGRTEAIIIPDISPWDIAAGALLVREAGGAVSDFTGQEWRLGLRDVLATNKKLQPKIIRDLKMLLK